MAAVRSGKVSQQQKKDMLTTFLGHQHVLFPVISEIIAFPLQ